ncbi:IQG1 [Sanghuangporus weigelae]
MDSTPRINRADSVSSTTSSTSRHGSEPFAYQTRILERTSSGSRSNFGLPKDGVLSSSNSGSRRWKPSHRVGSSVESVRGKWEERARAEAALSSPSPSRSSFSTDDLQSTAPYSPLGDEKTAGTRPSPSQASSRTAFNMTRTESSTPPSLVKRHTMPEPIVASPLSPNSTGISVVSPEPLSFSSASGTPTNRIRFPVSGPSVASVRQKFSTGTGAGESSDVFSELDGSSSRLRRSVDFDSIMKESRTITIPERSEAILPSTENNSKRVRATSLYGTSRILELPKQDFAASPSSDRHSRSSTPDSLRGTPTDKFARTSSAIPSSSDKAFRQDAFDIRRKASFLSSKQEISRSPSSPGRSNAPEPMVLPRRNSVKDSPFLHPSSPASNDVSPNTKTPERVYRPPPPAPSAFANSPSVMSPTPYRSSYMANKKAGLYGDGLTVGRKLGRHLPRIASGDAYDEPEPEPERQLPPEPILQSEPPRTPDKPSPESRSEKSPGMSSQLSRLERREKRLREWRLEMEGRSPTPKKGDAYSPEHESYAVPHTADAVPQSADDVAGVPGRKRLSRDVLAPAETPFGSPMPLPSSRLGIRGGLWADQQRHLLRAYEYLCHVGEAQQWIEGCLGEELGFGIVEMEESLRNGVVLAKLSRAFLGGAIVKRIFESPKLDYRQTDNINHFFYFVRSIGLPECFIFETTDLYNKRNIPKLKFSDDQLQRTEKGLKDAGVPMPNFSNVGRELAKEIDEEPEPEIETEEERRDRELLECEDSIVSLQSALRGFLIRKEQATHRTRIQLAERYIVKVQARCRGVATRKLVSEIRKRQANLVPWVLTLQAVARGVLARRAWHQRCIHLQALRSYIVKVQAQSRGVLQRRRFARLKGALAKSKVSVLKLQAVARARLVKKSHQQMQKTLGKTATMQGVVGLQTAARTVLVRRKVAERLRALKGVEKEVVQLQSHVRGMLVRWRVGAQLAKLDDATDVVVRIQSAARSFLARRRLLNLIRNLRHATSSIVSIQAIARAGIARQQHKALSKALGEAKVIIAVGSLQSLARAALVRKKHQEQSKKLEICMPDVVGLQTTARGALLRRDFIVWRDYLRNNQTEATRLQALLRGALVRRRFADKMKYYRENLEKVIKIQSLYRAKETRDQYRQLTLGRNVNVGTIKNFVHLLDDSEADFEDEIEVERLRKRFVESIRANQALETEVSELDVKIALVVQNVKSFEELVKARRRHDSFGAHTTRASVLAAHGDPFAGASSLDHESKRKLELYQQLFYLLQTRGDYLGKLFHQLAKVDISDKNKKLVERVVLTLFGYGQDKREEYLLLKLFQHCVKNEVAIAPSVESAMKEIPMYLSIALQYGRPKQVTYVRDVLQPLIWTVIDGVVNDEKLDLETDPCIIYRTRINIEEMRTGMKSSKPKDVNYRDAVMDPETRKVFIHNLQKLHAISKDFVNVIVGSAKKVPYCMRYLAREALANLKSKFPDEGDEAYVAPLARLLFHRYINPAIVAPETFDIVPNTIDIASRKNLAQISKMLTQIASGKEFGEEDPCLHPLDKYVAEAIKQLRTWVFEVADVQDAEAQFHANEFLDVATQPKPIYISPNEVYSMHSLLSQHLDRLAPTREDILRTILTELGGVPNLGTEELIAARDHAITLELTNRFANVKDPHAEEKALWVQAKRAVLAILRVQPARDLVECLMQPVSEEHEMFWEDIVDRELMNDHMRQRRRRMPSTTGAESAYRLDDVRSLTFKEVKAHAIYFLLELEKRGKVTREDGYQGILNAIAGDVRSKHRKRLQRQQELESMNEALRQLSERKKYYEEQIKSYNDYVEAAMNTMQKGKSKKRFVMPFTKQFFHLREMQRSGKSAQFGSFKYSAHYLYEKGILLSIDQYSPRQFDRIDVVMSSNKAGTFDIELYNIQAGPSALIASTEVRMEELLQAQFENRVSLPLFDGMARFNLNLLLYQINKK